MKAINIFLFLFLSLSCSNLKAQTNFLKGYYISASQDTLHGYIEYRAESRNYKVCVFKAHLNSKPIMLYPQDIIGFSIENKQFYEKHSFKSRKGDELFGFFKVLIKGKVSLLRYESRYFAKDNSNKVTEVSKLTEIIEDRKIKSDYYGLGMLKVLMKDCEEVTGGFLEREYESNPNFVHIFEKYHQCVGIPIYESERITIKPRVDLGVQASATLTYLTFSSTLQGAAFGNDLSYSIGGFASIFLPRVNERIRLIAEATYSRYNNYSYFSSRNTNNDLFVDYSLLKTPVLVRYHAKSFFIDIGFQNQLILDQNVRWRIETIEGNTVVTSDGQATPLNKWSHGYLVGAGFRYNNLKSAIRFSQPKSTNHLNKPVYQTIELIFSFQL